MKIKEYEDYVFLKLTSDSSATHQSIKLVKNYFATMQEERNGEKERSCIEERSTFFFVIKMYISCM